MKVKVVAFKVEPIYVIFNDELEVIGENVAPVFMMYPGAPFDIKKTVLDIESILGKVKNEPSNK